VLSVINGSWPVVKAEFETIVGSKGAQCGLRRALFGDDPCTVWSNSWSDQLIWSCHTDRSGFTPRLDFKAGEMLWEDP
jgi:hypothetical protein